MRRALDILNRQAGGQIHRDIEDVGRRLARVQVGIMRPGVFPGGLGVRTALGVAGPHDSGINEFVNSRGGGQKLGVLQFHLHHVPRHDIGHVHLEHVGPLLLQKGGALPGLFGLLVGLTGLIAFLDIRHDGALADGHFHAVNGGLGGGGEDVNGFEGLGTLVFVNLGHMDVGDDPGDVDLGGGGLQGQAVHSLLSLNDEIGRKGLIALLGHLGQDEAGKQGPKARAPNNN